MAIRILIADDHSLVRTGLRVVLDAESDIEVVGEAADGQEAVDRARELAPDLVLMDLKMPHLDGVEATRDLASLEPPVRVLILTTADADEDLIKAIWAGARGFLLKESPPEQVIEGIRVVAAGNALLPPPLLRRLLDVVVHTSVPPLAPGI